MTSVQVIFPLLLLGLLLSFDVGFAQEPIAPQDASAPNTVESRSSESPTADPNRAPQKLNVVVNGNPDVRSLGLCIAQTRELFRQEGLPEVDITWDMDANDKSPDLFKKLSNKETDFIISWMAEGVCARAQGEPIVAINLLSSVGTTCLLVRNDLDPTLTRVHGLNGKTVAVWLDNDKTARAIFAFLDLQVKYVLQREESNLLFNEGLVLASVGRLETNAFLTQFMQFRDNVRIFIPKDIECEFPETTVFCRESFLKEQPETCQKFVRAIYRGWGEVIQEPEKAATLLSSICRENRCPDDPFIIEGELEVWLSKFSLKSPLNTNGVCPPEQYDKLVGALITAKEITRENAPDYRHFFFNVLDEGEWSKIKDGARFEEQDPAGNEADSLPATEVTEKTPVDAPVDAPEEETPPAASSDAPEPEVTNTGDANTEVTNPDATNTDGEGLE